MCHIPNRPQRRGRGPRLEMVPLRKFLIPLGVRTLEKETHEWDKQKCWKGGEAVGTGLALVEEEISIIQRHDG